MKVEPDTGLITGCALTPASGPEHSDAAVGIALLAEETDPIEVLGDSAYGAGELLAAVADGAHTAIIKPCTGAPSPLDGQGELGVTPARGVDRRNDRPERPSPSHRTSRGRCSAAS